MSKIKAFTLAEILIVLVLIGVLTAILLPVAFHAAPDQDVMKFKKGYNTFANVIRELVTSDEYYKDGDLGVKSNGEKADTSSYFCEAFSDVVNYKRKNCPEGTTGKASYGYDTVFDLESWSNSDNEEINNVKRAIDNICVKAAVKVGEEIVMPDGIVYYEAGPGTHFAISVKDYFVGSDEEAQGRTFSENRYFTGKGSSGFYIIYKTFCMDIDGINKGEAPFGFGIRVDGKIYTGARADEWINKSIQKEDE